MTSGATGKLLITVNPSALTSKTCYLGGALGRLRERSYVGALS